jgi:hypothetical protein
MGRYQNAKDAPWTDHHLHAGDKVRFRFTAWVPQVQRYDYTVQFEAYDTAAVQNRGRRCSRCCCASRGDAAAALPLLRYPACSAAACAIRGECTRLGASA